MRLNNEIEPRYFQAPEQSFFLFGPRGTGKSMWVRKTYPDALLLDLLRPDVFREYSARPERLRDLVLGNPGRKHVVIDEVQKVPELLSVVHGLMEEEKSLTFILTGSSARKIKRAGVDLLAGRALFRTFHPFIASELGDRFSLDDALRNGMVPLVLASPDPAEVLRSYVALYVQEEVKMEGLVRNLGAFARFLEAASLSHGSVINISNVARECEAERNTVAGFVSILEDLLLAFRIPVFSRRAKRALSSHAKLYFFDAGVFRSLRPLGPLDRSSEVEGAALEGIVVQHLRAWNAYRGERNGLYFWRTRSGVEVDLVLYGKDGLWAIEVKNTKRIHPRDLRPLKTFLQDYPEARPLFLYRGEERLKTDGIPCIPCRDFLKALHPKRLPG